MNYMEGQEEVYNQSYLLTAESFKQHAHKLIKAATLLAGNEPGAHSMFFDQEDIRSGLADFFHGKIKKEMILEYKESEEGRLYIFKPITV